MRTDPSETGGLFLRRRPGTRPVKYRAIPQRGTVKRQRIDGWLAHGVLALMVAINLLYWGPLPVLWLWVASQVQYLTDSISLALAAGFVGLMTSLIAGLVVLRRLDQTWILVRRAAGHDQRTGVIGRIFAVTAVIGGSIFVFWLLIIQGPGSEFAPR